MPSDDYAERLARGEARAVLHAYGHPGAFERVCAERDDARVERDNCRLMREEETVCIDELFAEVKRLTRELDASNARPREGAKEE